MNAYQYSIARSCPKKAKLLDSNVESISLVNNQDAHNRAKCFLTTSLNKNFFDCNFQASATEVGIKNALSLESPSFCHDQDTAHPDFVVCDKGGWSLYFVLPSFSIDNDALQRIAFASFIVSQSLEVEHVFCLTIAKDDFEQTPFRLVEKTAFIKAMFSTLAEERIALHDAMQNADNVVSKACKTCVARQECIGDKLTIYDIPHLSTKKREAFERNGIRFLDDFICDPNSGLSEENLSIDWEEAPLTDKQRSFVRTFLDKEVSVDRQEFARITSDWTFPMILLDFETVNLAIPRYDALKPFTQVPFQYSAIILHEDGFIEYDRYLHLGTSDPRSDLAERLFALLSQCGTMVAYYDSFEKTVLRSLAIEFPQFAGVFNDVISKSRDLYQAVKASFKHHELLGSYSIKSVVEVLGVSESYSALSVQDGEQAQLNWLRLIELPDGPEKASLSKAQVEYCDKDTHEMLLIMRYFS